MISRSSPVLLRAPIGDDNDIDGAALLPRRKHGHGKDDGTKHH